MVRTPAGADRRSLPRRLAHRPGGGAGAFGTVAGVAAPGFAAYARILHPARLGERPVRWSTVAAAHGTRVTPVTRWHEVIGADEEYVNRSDLRPAPASGTSTPQRGRPCRTSHRRWCPSWPGHTGTPEQCWFGLWAGYGRWVWDRFPTPRPRAGRGAADRPAGPTPPPWCRWTSSRSCPICGGRRTAPGVWAETWIWSAPTSAAPRN
ncbi:hypothetical protein LT493_44470 [Streptomyces tricolor]|nr:hypothetical protein [Streptomyces tricolor]